MLLDSLTVQPNLLMSIDHLVGVEGITEMGRPCLLTSQYGIGAVAIVPSCTACGFVSLSPIGDTVSVKDSGRVSCGSEHDKDAKSSC